ncbi:heterokaryon incompatibility protein-domain-containing protein, partial [Bisporella sp. PMI_857]
MHLDLTIALDLTKFGVIPQTVSTTNTRPESSLPRIHAWLNQCNAHHEFCGQLRHGKDAIWHPKRLVDVSQELPRLEDDPKQLAGAKYTTLSYCWGPDPRFEKLQQSNYDNFKNIIIFSNLPRTLQDAVVFTRSLNIQYVWVDALCIIQDSTGNEDWLRESLTMSQVYGHSYLNMAASSSATADDGLFRERNPVALNGISVKSPDHPNEEYFIAQEKHWFHDFQFQPLNLRAWALQERRLSSRTIHFSEDQIYWECSQLCASETFPDGKPWDLQWSHRQKQITKARENAESNDRFEAWWWLVWEYSKGSLTQKSDRLVAIAGLAKSFATSKDQYFAGHWRNDMPHGLTWHASEASRGFKKTDLAPTWSWAS